MPVHLSHLLALVALAFALIACTPPPSETRTSEAQTSDTPQTSPRPQKILVVVTGASQMTSGKPTGLWLEEFAVPYNKFMEAGFEVTVASPQGGPAPIDPRSTPTAEQTQEWEDAAELLKTTVPLSSVRTQDFDAVFVPGGHGAMFDLPDDQTLIALLTEFAKDQKVIAAVCHGPAALVNVPGPDGGPLVKGRRVAAFINSEEDAVELTPEMPFLLQTRLESLGATVEAAPDFTPHAVRDQNLVTGQNPASSAPVADYVIQALRLQTSPGQN